MSDIVITCPSCQTSYKANVDSIGDGGRNVRCARCGETWFVPPVDIIDKLLTDPDALAHADNVAASQPTPPIKKSPTPIVEPTQPVESSPQLSTPMFGAARTTASQPTPDPDRNSDPVSAAIEPTASPQPSEPEPQAQPEFEQTPPPLMQDDDWEPSHIHAVGADVVMRDKVDYEKLARRRRTIKLIWAVPLILVLLAAIAAWFNRQTIVNRIPQMASIYQMLGADVRVGGLEIVPPEAQTVLVDGAVVIQIKSAVRNLTNKPKTVPLIELTLHDDTGTGLAQWYIEAGTPMIQGGESVEFTSEYADPPDGAVGLRYRFAGMPG